MLKYDVKLDENKNNIVLKKDVCLKNVGLPWCIIFKKNETAYHLFKTSMYV
jgi:hypothetical protein